MLENEIHSIFFSPPSAYQELTNSWISRARGKESMKKYKDWWWSRILTALSVTAEIIRSERDNKICREVKAVHRGTAKGKSTENQRQRCLLCKSFHQFSMALPEESTQGHPLSFQIFLFRNATSHSPRGGLSKPNFAAWRGLEVTRTLSHWRICGMLLPSECTLTGSADGKNVN